MATIKYTTFIFLISAILLGCNKFVEVDIPPNQLSSENVFNDENSATAAVSGIYASLSTGFLSANMQFAMGYSFEDLIYNGSDDNYRQFMNKSIQVDNSFISSFWNGLYQYIYYCNSALESLDNSNLNLEFKKRLIAECLFVRAFCYSYLVKCWGGVPLILTTDWQANQSVERSSYQVVYQQIISDLEEAKILFEDVKILEHTRANYYSATALLSRVYIQLQDWEKAEENANIVLTNTLFALENTLNVFLSNSRETLFQLSSINPSYQNTNIGQQIIPWSSTSIPAIGIPEEFLSEFSENDLRVNNWIENSNVQNIQYYFPFKYREGRFSTERRENLIVMRLAEQYLNRSIARLELGRQEEALSDLNIVRSRASNAYTTITRENIYREFRLEYFCEWGLTNLKTDMFWPIPMTQMDANPFLEQNPGY